MTPEALGTGRMFDGIAKKYDLLNRINSLGMDGRWRKKTVQSLSLEPGQRILDVATGTGDLLMEVHRRHPNVSLVGLDPSAGMMDVAKEKFASRGIDAEMVQGDVQELPFEDGSFDAVSICFGIRNVKDRPRGLREMARVLRPGGRLAVLELSEPEGFFAKLHVEHVVPRVGAALSSDEEYQYLRDSIARFPSPEAFSQIIEASGFGEVSIQKFAFGACVLFVAGRA